MDQYTKKKLEHDQELNRLAREAAGKKPKAKPKTSSPLYPAAAVVAPTRGMGMIEQSNTSTPLYSAPAAAASATNTRGGMIELSDDDVKVSEPKIKKIEEVYVTSVADKI